MDVILNYLQYPFVRYALIVGVLISLCSSLLGVLLVLKRYSYIGDGLSHVAFGAMAISAVLHMTDQKMFVILPLTVAAAVVLLKKGRNAKIQGDAKIAMISVSSLALGYLLMNRFSASANVSADVCSTLFGSTSILTLTKGEVWLCVILSLLVVLMYVLLHPRIFAVTFDEDFARASGMNTDLYNLLIAVITAVIIVLAMNLVGSLLISALVIFPSITAMLVCHDFRSVTILSAVTSVGCALVGMLLAIVFGTPVGSTIVLCDLILFALVYVISLIRGKGR